MKISEILRKAQKLIDAPNKLAFFVFAKDACGHSCAINAKNATQFCARGAIKRVEHTNRNEAGPAEMFLASLSCIHKEFEAVDAIARFNNTSAHDDVMMLFDFAILAAKDEGK